MRTTQQQRNIEAMRAACSAKRAFSLLTPSQGVTFKPHHTKGGVIEWRCRWEDRK